MKFRNAFSPRVHVVVAQRGVSRTKQSEAAACDINKIMARYTRTGVLDHFAKFGGQYGFAEAKDFRESMETVRVAREMFEALPSKVRGRFGNDPEAFMGFVQDEKNLPAMRELGLALPAKAKEPSPVERRVADLEVEDAARLEVARKGLKVPPAAPGTVRP